MNTVIRTYRFRQSLLLLALTALVIGMLPSIPALADAEARGTDQVCDSPFTAAFDDVEGSAHEDNVLCMAGHGLTEGTGDGTSFSPRREVTRAQMASFVARFIEHYTGEALPESAERFGDVPGDFEHATNIHKLFEIGVTEGTAASDGESFAPQQSVTRAQMASFISRAATYIEDGQAQPETQPPRANEDFFSDDDGSTHEDNINALAAVGIVEGFDDGTYRPGDSVFRDQMASFVMRSYDWAVVAELGLEDPGEDPEILTVAIDAPTSEEPAEALAGEDLDITFTAAADAGEYELTFRASDEGHATGWTAFDGDAAGAVTGEEMTVTATVPSETPDGEYDIRAVVTDGDRQAADTAEGALQVVPAEPGAISGVVVDAETGEPIAGVDVTLVNGELVTTTTNEDGAYLFEGLTPGDAYDVFADNDGYESDENTSVAVVAGETTEDVDFALAPLAFISGVVMDVGDAQAGDPRAEGAEPIEDATVTVHDGDQVVAVQTTGEDGSYQFALSGGTYDLEARAEGYLEAYGWRVQGVEAGPGDSQEEIDFALYAEGEAPEPGSAEVTGSSGEDVDIRGNDDDWWVVTVLDPDRDPLGVEPDTEVVYVTPDGTAISLGPAGTEDEAWWARGEDGTSGYAEGEHFLYYNLGDEEDEDWWQLGVTFDADGRLIAVNGEPYIDPGTPIS